MNKKNLISAIVRIALIVLALFVLVSCTGPNKPEKPADKTEVPVSTEAPEAGDPTEVPATEVPATEIPATEVPTEEPTDTPAPTEPPTEAPTHEPVKSGTNVALDAAVEVSSTTGDVHVQWGWSYEFINDGYYYEPEIPSAGWTTAVQVNFDDPEQEEWVLLTLAQDTSVNKIAVYPVVNGSHFPESFKVMVSADGQNFTTVGEVNDNTRAADKDTTPFVFEFDAVTCRYVQFLATKLYSVPSPADGYLCQVAEIEVFAA